MKAAADARLTALVGSMGEGPEWDDVARTRLGDGTVLTDDSASAWPFRRLITPEATVPPETTILLRDLGRAFPSGQAGSTRLVLTQSTYQLQRWLDWLDANPHVTVVADLSSASAEVIGDASARRGPWARIDVVEVSRRDAHDDPGGVMPELVRAFRQTDATTRVEACRQAVDTAAEDAALLLSWSSALMETQQLDESRRALERAREVAPDWEAVHYELGKLWLRADDTERAAAAFAETARLMPTFAAAHSNLGAALGELERATEALVALERAVRLDPFGHTVHNNLGATLRDLGRLPEAEASFRRVVELAPWFVFGHYNLGHALFLQGRFVEARRAYEEGLERDPARTPQQRARLALACAAAGDGAAACAHAEEALEGAHASRRRDIHAEMAETVEALRAVQGPADPTAMLQRVLDAMGG